MSERLRDNFSDRPQLERELLDIIVSDGVITRAALNDMFEVRGISREDVHDALTNLKDASLIEFWNRTPAPIEKRIEEHGLRPPIFDHTEDKGPVFSSRTASMLFTPGIYGLLKEPDKGYGEETVAKIDEIKRRW